MRRPYARSVPFFSAFVISVAAVLAVLAVVLPPVVDAQGPGSWSTLRPLNTFRTEVGGAVVGGRLHVVGGFPGGTGGPGAHEVYEPVSNTWNTLAPLPADLNHVAAVQVNQSLYVVGGWT